MKGKIYLIPTVISEEGLSDIPAKTVEVIHKTKVFLVERARTARRFIKQTNPPYKIEELVIIEIEEKDGTKYNFNQIVEILDSGQNLGIMSEAGCPGIADPGSEVVSKLHRKKYELIPLTGPSSIFLALMASGLNGQNFSFNGYLPIKDDQLKIKLSQLESLIFKTNQTQIFIETPYRNDRMFKFLCSTLNPKILLCIAIDISGNEQKILTKSVAEWKKINFKIGKYPTVFLLGNA